MRQERTLRHQTNCNRQLDGDGGTERLVKHFNCGLTQYICTLMMTIKISDLWGPLGDQEDAV